VTGSMLPERTRHGRPRSRRRDVGCWPKRNVCYEAFQVKADVNADDFSIVTATAGCEMLSSKPGSHQRHVVRGINDWLALCYGPCLPDRQPFTPRPFIGWLAAAWVTRSCKPAGLS
jgi:hypothetical protein